MNIKRLFGVLFITVMLLSMPCAYATDDSSDNMGFIINKYVNKGFGNFFIISVIKDCSSIISLYKMDLMKRPKGNQGVLQDVCKREHYEKPSVKRKKKAEATRKRKY